MSCLLIRKGTGGSSPRTYYTRHAPEIAFIVGREGSLYAKKMSKNGCAEEARVKDQVC